MIGSRLKLAREATGWSLRELEDRIGGLVTAQAIGKYERGEMMPGSKVLLALASTLGVSAEYLLSERDISLEEVDFRKMPAEGAREERRFEAAVIDAAERYMVLESALPNAALEWRRPCAPEFRISSIEDAEGAAIRLRDIWKLGIDPIVSVTELLEDQGIKVISLNLPDAISGSKAIARVAGSAGVAMIVVNARHNGERQRFTLAHELAHFVLECDRLESSQYEKAADWFAGAFLVAKETLEKVIGRSRTAITFGELVAVKRVFRVSLSALAVRLRQLGIVTKAVFGEIWGVLKAKGLTIPGAQEPEPVAAEVPNRAKRLALRAVSEGAMSDAKAAELLRLRRRQFDELRDLQMA